MPHLIEDEPLAEIPALSAPGPRGGDYVPFGNMESRNGLQERVEIPLMLRALRVPGGGRVLEVGCGRGVALPLLAQRLAPSALVAVDIDATLLAHAASRCARAGVRAELRHADVRALPLESASLDLVIDFGTCYHVSGGEDGARQALTEIARVLRPGGAFVHETRVAQHLAHPVRSFAKSLPWTAVPSLVVERTALLWTMRRRVML